MPTARPKKPKVSSVTWVPASRIGSRVQLAGPSLESLETAMRSLKPRTSMMLAKRSRGVRSWISKNRTREALSVIINGG